MAVGWLGFVDQSGQFKLDDRKKFIEWVKRFAGHEVVLTVKQKRSQRSLDQNAYWWAVPVRILAEELGYTDSQMHYALLGECFGYRPGPAGHAIPNVPSSSELNTEQFSHLIDWVLTWAPTELNVRIPAPSEWDGE